MFRIQHHFTYGWDDLFEDEFETYQDAQHELNEFLLDARDAFELRYLSDAYKRRDFRIKEY